MITLLILVLVLAIIAVVIAFADGFIASANTVFEKMESTMNKLKKMYIHWLWLHRYNKAWKRAKRRANFCYHEDISSCSPWFYFHDELEQLKSL